MESCKKVVCVVVTLAVVFGACTAKDAVKDVDVTKYLGRWYQTHTNYYSDFFAGIQDSECVSATYEVISALNVTVYNAYKTRAGVIDEIRGYAYIPDPREPGKLLVALEGVPVDAPYWIFKLGPIVNDQYEYSVVSDNAALGLFVLARDVPRFKELYEAEVLEYLQLTGFTGPRGPIEEYHGTDCEYPPFSR
ncbi:apolipoprotein D-like [Amphiura filiformis]|uniref:apolipoprotein D-like n=1 Tax=Amphiura filiformis TaxID=82378 RepID=UPI003B20B871